MPPHHLYDISVNILQRGHHLFVEKPPGVTAFQTSSLAKTAAKYGALTMTAFNRRFIPLMREVRRQVEARGADHPISIGLPPNTSSRRLVISPITAVRLTFSVVTQCMR